MQWLSKLISGLRRWMAANAKAHAEAKPHSCCSAPPPGAGHPKPPPARKPE